MRAAVEGPASIFLSTDFLRFALKITCMNRLPTEVEDRMAGRSKPEWLPDDESVESMNFDNSSNFGTEVGSEYSEVS